MIKYNSCQLLPLEMEEDIFLHTGANVTIVKKYEDANELPIAFTTNKELTLRECRDVSPHIRELFVVHSIPMTPSKKIKKFELEQIFQLFDYVIVGAGLSGIYLYSSIREKSPDLRIAILEQSMDIGGCIGEFRLHNQMVSNGPIRFSTEFDASVISLFDKYGVPTTDFPNYTVDSVTIDIHATLSKLKTLEHCLAKDWLKEHYLYHTPAYFDLVDENITLADYYTRLCRVVSNAPLKTGNMIQLLRKMVEKEKEKCTILFGTEVKRVDGDQILTNKNIILRAKKVIWPRQVDHESLDAKRIHRIYSYLDEPFTSANMYAHLREPLHSREIYTFTTDDGNTILMLYFGDAEFHSFWNPNVDDAAHIIENYVNSQSFDTRYFLYDRGIYCRKLGPKPELRAYHVGQCSGVIDYCDQTIIKMYDSS